MTADEAAAEIDAGNVLDLIHRDSLPGARLRQVVDPYAVALRQKNFSASNR